MDSVTYGGCNALYEKQEELSEEDFKILSEVDTEILTEELSETRYSAGIETEESTEDSLTESETEQKVLTDFEIEEIEETDSVIILKAETEIAEDTFSQKQISEKICNNVFCR